MNTFLLLLGIIYFMIIIYSMCTISSIYSRESVSLMDMASGPELIEVIQNAYSSGSIYCPFASSYRKYYSRYGLVIFWAVWICFLMVPEVIGTLFGALIIGVFKLISKICYKHKEG